MFSTRKNHNLHHPFHIPPKKKRQNYKIKSSNEDELSNPKGRDGNFFCHSSWNSSIRKMVWGKIPMIPVLPTFLPVVSGTQSEYYLWRVAWGRVKLFVGWAEDLRNRWLTRNRTIFGGDSFFPRTFVLVSNSSNLWFSIFFLDSMKEIVFWIWSSTILTHRKRLCFG